MPRVPDITVSFVCRKLERDFDIRLTPEELHAEMVRKTGGSPERYCCADLLERVWDALEREPSVAEVRRLRPTYYRVRAALGVAWELPWSELKPSTPLRGLIGGRDAWKLWRALSRELQTPLPEMHISDRVGYAAMGSAMLLSVVLFAVAARYALIPTFFAAREQVGVVSAALMGVPALLGVVVVLLVLSLLICSAPLRLFASVMPFRTVRDLVEYVAEAAPASERVRLPWSRELAWFLLRRTLRDSRLHEARHVTRQTPLIGVLRIYCGRCGYDLRSSMYRCPECGEEV